MTTTISDEDLIRYCDLEMTPQQRYEFEQSLADNPDLSKKLDEIRRSDRLLRAWNFQIDKETLTAPDLSSYQRNVSYLQRISNLPMALAASIATLGIGLFLGFKLSSSNTTELQISDVNDNLITQSTLITALETAPSNKLIISENHTEDFQEEATITRTWQLDSGDYCREYTYVFIQIDGTKTTEQGAACRSKQGEWKARLKLFPKNIEI